MDPDPEDNAVFRSLCSNNERLLKEMNDYLASISRPNDSRKSTPKNVSPDRNGSVNKERATTRSQIDANEGESDYDSLVIMAQKMDAASVISDPSFISDLSDKDHHARIPLPPLMEISAGMEKMLAQFTDSDPSIKKKPLHPQFNSSDPVLTKTPPYVPMRPNLKQSNAHSSAPTSPISPKFDAMASETRMKRGQPPHQTTSKPDILPFPNFGNTSGRRRLSLERVSDAEAKAVRAALQKGRKTTKSTSKYKEFSRGKDGAIVAKHIPVSSQFSKGDSAGSKPADSSSRRRGWHTKKMHNQDGDSDDELMCGVGINTRVHDEKQNGIKSKTNMEKKKHQTEKRQIQTESKSKMSSQRRSQGTNNSSRRGLGKSNPSESHRRSQEKNRQTGASQRDNSDIERLSNQANSRRQSEGDVSIDNSSAYNSDDETQFFYESVDDGELDSEDELKAVGTSVADAVKDLNEKSAVAKVKNLFKLH